MLSPFLLYLDTILTALSVKTICGLCGALVLKDEKLEGGGVSISWGSESPKAEL